MTTLLRTFVAALFAAACASPQAAAARQGPARPESQRLSVEVVSDRGGHAPRFEVPERASEEAFADFNAPHSVTGWERPPGRPPLTRVRLRASYEGDAVRIKVAAVFDDSHLDDAPGPKYGAREEPVASLLARAGETLTVEGFGRFGAKPLVLRVARFEPEPEPPPTPAPSRAVNVLKAVEVVSFTAAGAQLERGLLTLLNVSSKNIVALEVSVPDGGMSQQAHAAAGGALMRPGGTYQTEITLGSRGAQGGVPEPRPDALVVTAVVFEDGSYEGDTEPAARMSSRQKGRLTQFARVLTLLEGALDAPGLDAAALEGLKSRVAGLRVDAEQPLTDELLSLFPKLPAGEGRKLVASAALEGLSAGRAESLHVIGRAAARGTDTRRQLEAAREEIRKRAGASRD